MKSRARNAIAVITGVVCGSVLNFALVSAGMELFPLPPGTDPSSMEDLRRVMRTLPPENFMFPFLGHALGTAAGAYLTSKFAASHQRRLSLSIGVFFLLGGLAMILNCGGPVWFIATDLLLAYLPMAFVGHRLSTLNQSS